MKKEKFKFVCQECGYESFKWLGRCPCCNNFSTFVEEQIFEVKTKGLTSFSIDKPVPISQLKSIEHKRKKLSSDEINRVLGGGIVSGSLVLIGGEPGIGKSTLLLQVSNFIAENFGTTLYVSGEESPVQVKLRADRLNCLSEKLFFVSETELQKILKYIKDIKPQLVVIDSIQTIFNSDIPSSPGSVGQLRECTSSLMHIAKQENVPIFIIGHVTKEGAIAGPKILEHIVDTVLYFEGEKYQTFRMLRCVKNRFGSTSEIGLFEMKEHGLLDVSNPSDVFLGNRRDNDISGFCIACVLEGTRPIILEVQSLVSFCGIGIPRRTCQGMDYNRLALLLAVLEKRLNFNFSHQDVYINLPGGIKTNDIAIDIAVAASVVSSLKNTSIDSKTVVIGEVGLTGEVRNITGIEKRIKEADRLGFKKIITPHQNFDKIKHSLDIEIIGISNIREGLEELNLL